MGKRVDRYGGKTRRDLHREASALRSQAALQLGAFAARTADLEKWLKMAVEGSFLLGDPRSFGPVPDGALAVGGLTTRIVVEEQSIMGEEPEFGGTIRRSPATVRGGIEVWFLSPQFRRIDLGSELVLVTKDGRRLIIRITGIDQGTVGRFSEALLRMSLEFVAIRCRAQEDAASAALEIVHSIGRREPVYLLEDLWQEK